MQLVISNNSTSNPQTLDLTNYIRVSDGEGMDPASPTYSDKVISHSLLKEGGFLALENVRDKELVFPLRLKASSSPAVIQLAQQINQIVTTAGATASWQDDGMSQPTIFDLISGQLDVEYRYREAQQFYLPCKLRLFSQPFGRTAAPRLYATASGVGPLLMITPYASGGALTAAASTQAAVSGFGVPVPGGVPSSGAFFWGAPSLAGDAPAQLQISYAGPLPTVPLLGIQPRREIVPYVAAALLPDANYKPLITNRDLGGTGASRVDAGAIASQYSSLAGSPGGGNYSIPLPTGILPTSWQGQHRCFAIARASNVPLSLMITPVPGCPNPTSATVYPGDWQIVDLGTVTFGASQRANTTKLDVLPNFASISGVCDVTGVAMIPDNQAWFFNPTTLTPSQYGDPNRLYVAYTNTNGYLFPAAAFSNNLILDDVGGQQYVAAGQSQLSLSGLSIPSTSPITSYTRGLIARPDPKGGLPIIAILGIGQWSAPSGWAGAGASWANPQNLQTTARINIVERTRYVLS